MQKILIIDDDSSIRKTLQLHLQSSSVKIETAPDLRSAEEIWPGFKPHIVLLDLSLPDGDGIEFFEHATVNKWSGLVILITGNQDMDRATEAMRLGAYDYLMKPLDIDQLETVMERAFSFSSSSSKTGTVVEGDSDYKPGKIIGKSRAILELHKIIGSASRSFANVLIRGETGTGKELVAKAIHRNTCFDAPFVAVNCSAIVPTLLESELFGHEKGAFTGAIASKPGQLELARNGVIFLDEIGDMAQDLQVKLLRVLQEREFKRVGGSLNLPLKARIITATHRDLEKMVRDGDFREDLYYRMKVLEINIPPLRKRKEDIPLITTALLQKINREIHGHVTMVSESDIRRL
ncbi:MAG: sigma-54-dependent Fis family transcriptional regulator, partial [FCB group bacterium]|nr:sigma-54-dependent Fis family transcriptional regulator [FCB group bacterium]